MFSIDPDIRRAKTLPSWFYTDEDLFQRSKEKIFARSWQFAGRASDVDNLCPLTLLPEMLDEPLLLTRKDGHLTCLSNVCTHRGKILVERSCKADLIRCGYHGRRFDLAGKFLSMPEFADVADFPSEADNLTEVALSTVGDHLFASLDPAVRFEEFAGGALNLISEAPAAELKESREYYVDAHWALYCENYLEGFHIPFVHRSLNEIVDYGTYKMETFRYTSLQTGYDAQGQIAGQYLFVFPNTMFNLYPWGISVNIVEPLSPSLTRVRFLTYISNDTKLAEGAGADLHGVELEDEAVVESVQRGIRSRFYSHGRYSPSRETGTHHFHRLIAEFMGDEGVGR